MDKDEGSVYENSFWGTTGESRRNSAKGVTWNINSGHFDNWNAPQADDKSTKLFCCRENLEECLKYLSQELECEGLIGADAIGRKAAVNLVSLANSVYELLLRYRKSLRQQEEIEGKFRRATCDLEHCQMTVQRLQDVLDQKERALGAAQERERQLLENAKLLQSAVKYEKDEVRRLNSILAQRDAQYVHDSRKSEREKSKLRDKCQQLLMDKSLAKQFAQIEILNPLQRSDGSRCKWKTPATIKKNEEEFHQAVCKNLEDRVQLLVGENESLREITSYVYFALDKAVNSLARVDEDQLRTTPRKEYFKLPYDIIRSSLQKSIDKKLERLTKALRCTTGCNTRKFNSGDTFNLSAVEDEDGALVFLPQSNSSNSQTFPRDPECDKQRQLFTAGCDHFPNTRIAFTSAVSGASDESPSEYYLNFPSSSGTKGHDPDEEVSESSQKEDVQSDNSGLAGPRFGNLLFG